MRGFLNKRKVREYALETAKSRAHKFTRVGGDFYIKCEAHLRAFIHDYLHRLPSVGRTIK